MRLALALLVLVGCGAPARGAGGDAPVEAKTEPSKPPPLTLKDGGETVRIVQRASAILPGSNDALELRLGDITGGAVELVLSKRDGSAVLVTKSVHDGDVVPFALDGFDYELVVEHMENLLVGDDWVELRVRAAGQEAVAPQPDAAVDERARIEKLIDAVAKSGIVFIRNGSEHSASEAADHLRTKWSRAGDRVKTADDFIEALGSRSSQSGEPYRVRLPDGTERDSGPWLRELLAAQ
ncbi:MAG TPA: DUF5329 domain-containing protein [Nannocystaceae bacterium]|nr:DUF5329 domain-containing protein [Nannocystaceae bacterium]